MKKFLIHLFIYCFIILVIDNLSGWTLDYFYFHAQSGSNKEFIDLCMNDEHDVIILGSSRAHHHYVPDVLQDSLGMDCYNAGYDGNGILLHYNIYKWITNRYKPKLIIYDVEPAFDILKYKNDNNCTRYLKMQRPLYRTPEVTKLFQDVSNIERYKCHSGLFRYNSSGFTIIREYFQKRSVVKKNGYVPLYGKINEDFEIGNDGNNYLFEPLKLSYLKKMLEDASMNNIPLVVIISPKYGATNNTVFNELYEYCKEFDIKVFDYYTAPEFSTHKEYFKEPMHLNDEGAHLFSQTIISELRAFLTLKREL